MRVALNVLTATILAGISVAVGTPPAVAVTVADVLPIEWQELHSVPVDWMQVTDISNGGVPRNIEGVTVLVPGQAIELRVKLTYDDMPSPYAETRASVAQFMDRTGYPARGPLRDLGKPETFAREVWVYYRVPEDAVGGFILALTTDAADGQPGYMLAALPIVVPPAAVDPGEFLPPPDSVGALPPMPSAPTVPVAPAPAPPVVPEQAVPAPAPAEDVSVPAAESPSAEQNTPVVETVESDTTPAAPSAQVAASPVDAPPWLFPATLGIAGAGVVAAVVTKVVSSSRRNASIRRLANRP